jgi:hypothetical protein
MLRHASQTVQDARIIRAEHAMRMRAPEASRWWRRRETFSQALVALSQGNGDNCGERGEAEINE